MHDLQYLYSSYRNLCKMCFNPEVDVHFKWGNFCLCHSSFILVSSFESLLWWGYSAAAAAFKPTVKSEATVEDLVCQHGISPLKNKLGA